MNANTSYTLSKMWQKFEGFCIFINGFFTSFLLILFIFYDFRGAQTSDIKQMSSVRLSVKENKLSNPELVTLEDYEQYLTRSGKGWICETGNQTVGFSIADIKGHNIWALFVRPEYEGLGIGRKLHEIMINWYFSQTTEKVWLGTWPKTRADRFYRTYGWKETGRQSNGEIKFELTFDDWNKLQKTINKP